MNEEASQLMAPLIVQTIEDLLVVNKPAGLATAGRSLHDIECLQWEVSQRLDGRPVWAIHQLDKDTSGLCLFTTRAQQVSRWADALRSGEKTYLAICHGGPTQRITDIFSPIGKKRMKNGREIPAVVKTGKPAHSTVEVLQRGANYSALRVRIHTGRTHQVRLHLASIGCPLVGERLHRQPPCLALDRHALHAWTLRVSSGDGSTLRLTQPAPPDLIEFAAEHHLELKARP